MYVPQKQLENVKKSTAPNKAVILYGPRRCGKTTLLTKFAENIKEDYLFVSGEDITVQDYLGSESIEKLREFAGKKRLLIIDEAQKIKKIGLNIKLILDHIPDIKVIASGSSSFDLAKQIGEPLTGRKITLRMFPLSQIELNGIESAVQTKASLETRLIYGTYPEVVINKDRKENIFYIREIINSYLYKDILELEGIKHSDKLSRLLQLLAFQIGKEVSYNEIGRQLGMSKNTVDKYLDLLEKAFVIYKIKGFSRNLRKEITKNPRFYFYDLGIRNGLINNFNTLSVRNDVGMLWENYIVTEKIKKQEYCRIPANNYFWRTYDQKEIDLVEEYQGKLYGYNVKWAEKETKSPKDWHNNYPNAEYHTINRVNYLKYIT